MSTVTLRDYEVQYRGRSSSKRYNDALSQIQDDLITCLEQLQKINSKFLNLEAATNYQNQAATAKANSLLDAASGCLDVYLLGGTDKISTVSMYDRSAVIDGDARHNALYGQITLPATHSNSKIPILETPAGNFEAVPGVTIELWEGLSGSYATVDRTHPVYRAVDHNFSTFWVNEYGANPTRVRMKLSYPSAVSPSVNVITVNPFPETAVQVNNIQYNSLSTFQTIPGFVPTKDRSIYYFESVEVSDQITIELVTSTTMNNTNGNPVYPYGLQIADVGFVDLIDTAYSVVRLKSSSPGFSTMTSFDTDTVINTIEGTPVTDYVRFEIFKVEQVDWTSPSAGDRVYDSDKDTYPYTTDLPSLNVEFGGGPVDSLFVKMTLNKVANTTPVVRGMTLTYTDGT